MIDVSDIEVPSQDDVQFDLRSLFLGAIRASLETLLEEEIRGLVGASRWARMGRKDHRNGSYLRGLVTSMGHLDVEVMLRGRAEAEHRAQWPPSGLEHRAQLATKNSAELDV